MKYGLHLRAVGTKVRDYPELRKLAIKGEKYGFDSIHISDHFFYFAGNREPWVESIVSLAALAEVTKKVKLAHNVLCRSFRNPAYLAKIFSTLDVISNGRIQIWLGAGFNEIEYKAYGYPFPSPKQRVDEIDETIDIMKKLFTEKGNFDFKGKFWQLEQCENYPKPIQKPYPPIILGSKGILVKRSLCTTRFPPNANGETLSLGGFEINFSNNRTSDI